MGIADASAANVPVTNANGHNEYEDRSRSLTITEIIKPTRIRSSTSGGVHGVDISFEVLRFVIL